MIIPVLTAANLTVKPGIGRHIHLTAQDRIDARLPGRPVKINDAEHDAMVGDGTAVHAQLLYPLNALFDLIRTVQQAVLRVDMQMCKFHGDPPCFFCRIL